MAFTEEELGAMYDAYTADKPSDAELEAMYDARIGADSGLPQSFPPPLQSNSAIGPSGEPHVDLSRFGSIGNYAADGYNAGVDGLDSLADYFKTNAEPRDMGWGETLRSGMMGAPLDVLNMAREVPTALGKFIGGGAAEMVVPDPSPMSTGELALQNMIGTNPRILKSGYREVVPEGSDGQMAASALGGILGSIPAVKPFKGMVGTALHKVEKAALPYLGSLGLGFGENQAEQLAGMAIDRPLEDDLKGLTRQGISGAGVIFPGTLMRTQAAGIAGGIEGVARRDADRLGSFLNKDLNRAAAFFDNPEQAVTRQGVPMVDALKDPEIRPIFENLPKGSGARFNLWTEVKDRLWGNKEKNYDGEINTTGRKIDDLIDGLPPQATIKAREILDHSNWQKLEAEKLGEAGGATAKVVRGVINDETIAFADMALSSTEAPRFKELFKKQDRSQRGVTRTIGGMRQASITPAEKLELDTLTNKIKDMELSPAQLREMKTRHDKFARYDALSDPDIVSRSDIYKNIGSIFRDRLHDTFKKNSPQTYDAFVASNKKFGVLMDLEDAVAKRETTVNLYGSRAPVGGFQAREGQGSDISTDKFPEIDTPEARLYRASTLPWETMTRPGQNAKYLYKRFKAASASVVPAYASAANELFNSPFGATSLGARAAAHAAAPARVPLGINDISSMPESSLPPELVNDKAFMDFYKNAGDMEEENQITELTNYIVNNPEAKNIFERSPYIGYAAVKDSQGEWRIMDANQRVSFAQKIIKEEPDLLIQAKKLIALNQNGRIMQGGRVTLPKDSKAKSSTVKTGTGTRQDPNF